MFLIGEGFALDMIARIKANRASQKKINLFKKNDEKIYERKRIQLKFKEVSPKQKSEFLSNMQKEYKKQRIFERIALAVLAIVFVVFLFWLQKKIH